MLGNVKYGLKTKRNNKVDDKCLESLWLNVCPRKSNRSILVGAFYRPRSTRKEIENLIESAYLNTNEMILVGNVNLNYLDESAYLKHRLLKTFKSM